MKRVLAAIICLAFMMNMGLPAAAAGEVTPVSNAEELAAIRENPEGSYRLEDHIDLNGMDWTPIPFYGHLDGNGYTIYNLHVTSPGEELATSVDGNYIQYETVYAGLFSTCKDATIENLHILGADVNIETDQHCFAAILTGYMENTDILNCTIDGRVQLFGTNVMVGVGGVAGFGKGSIRDCSADVELVFADRSEGIRCEQFMGGLLSCGNANLVGCNVTISGVDSCSGYVHNGGLIGMHYCYDSSPSGWINSNHVSGTITFFENNIDRRAYCAPFCGEPLSYPDHYTDNTEEFYRNELFNQTEELKAHACESPTDIETVVKNSCDAWGYTLHTCENCSYEYRTDYTAPGHQAGQWQQILEPDYDRGGLEQLCCEVCGQVLEEREIPKLEGTREVNISDRVIMLYYKEMAPLSVEVLPESSAEAGLIWSSSDETVATVTPDGEVYAAGRGEATITCTSADGRASDSCRVNVDFSTDQWLIEIFLFGWLWY